jgi:glycosyltransferase involved in cell wall biosynthesis
VTRACPTWDLLIASIPHRHETLCELLACLDAQITACEALGRVGVLLYRDNLTVSYGEKTAALVAASEADYVSCIDDDDLLSPDGLARVLIALGSEPDYVGFAIGWTRDGEQKIPVEHSLRHPRWEDGPERLLRSVMQFNPIRRELAVAGQWSGGYGAEKAWGDRVIATGRCQTEAWIPPPPVYLYREKTGDTFLTGRQALADVKPLPAYPWLTVLAAPGSC